MGENFKPQNKKKYQNKLRYRDLSKVVPKASTSTPSKVTLSETKLEKNWDRYEEPNEHDTISGEEDEILTSKDFRLLAEAPISRGAYFQFKKDKQFLINSDEKLHMSDTFDMNLNLIGLSIETIPFYERIKMDKDCFSTNGIREMESTAETNRILYVEYLQKLKEQIVIEDTNLLDSDKKETDDEVNEPITDLENWLEEILS